MSSYIVSIKSKFTFTRTTSSTISDCSHQRRVWLEGISGIISKLEHTHLFHLHSPQLNTMEWNISQIESPLFFLSLSLSLSHTHTHTHKHTTHSSPSLRPSSLSLTPTKHTHSLSPTISLSFSHSLSLTHTNTPSLSHTQTHTLPPLSLFIP